MAFQKKLILLGAIVIVAIAGIWYGVSQKKQPLPETITIKKGLITQDVEATGRVESTTGVDILPQVSGRLVRVRVSEGATVKKGQLLAELDAGKLDQDIRTLEKLIARTPQQSQPTVIVKRPVSTQPVVSHPINTQELARLLEQARREYGSAQTQANQRMATVYAPIGQDIADASARAADVIYKTTQPFFTGFPGQLIFQIPNIQIRADVEARRARAVDALVALQRLSSSIPNDYPAREVATVQAYGYVERVGASVQSLLDVLAGTTSLDQGSLANYRSTATIAQSSVAGILSRLSQRQQVIVQEKEATEQLLGSLLARIRDLEQRLHGLRSTGTISLQKISQQKAAPIQGQSEKPSQRAQLQAQLKQLRVFKEGFTIKAPADGVVRAHVAQGDIVVPGKSLFTISAPEKLAIVASVSSVDGEKIKKGQAVRIQFSDIPGKEYFGTVRAQQDGKATIDIFEPTTGVREGFTAQLSIQIFAKKEVIVIPPSVVTHRDGKTFVRRVDGDKVHEVPVELGAVGQSGDIEVTTGLDEGDIVVVSK